MLLQELFEAISSGKVDGAMSKIVSYIEKGLGVKLIKIPGVEHFKNSKEEGYGLRYVFASSTKCIRFNWATGSVGKSASIVSIDVWNGSSRNPDYNIRPEGVSLVKILPSLVKTLQNPKTGKQTVFASSDSEVSLTEAKKDDYTAESALKDMLRKMEKGSTFTRSEFAGMYHIAHIGIFDTIMSGFSNMFNISNKRVSWKDDADLNEIYNAIISERDGTLEVTSGGSGETYEASREEERIEETEHVSFSDSIEHLQGLVKGVAKGAFNALFCAGAGGVGKTQTIEDTLSDLGLTDGNGYFKLTGSASPFGIYEMLYKNRNGIVLFDDCDGALADQDGRNLIKAATDTKKIRKMAWSKKNSNLYDPAVGIPKKKGKKEKEVDIDNIDDDEEEDKEEEKSTMIPSYFNFEGQVIFISNLPLDKLDPDGALRTRAFVIAINPTNEEVFERMQQILYSIKLEAGTLSNKEREDVLEIIKTRKKKGPANLRTLVRALNIASSGASNAHELIRLYA